MKKINEGLSNSVYLNEKENKIIKKYSYDEFKKYFYNQEVEILNKIGIKNKILKEGQVEMEYFEHEKFDDENISDQDLISVSNSLKFLHKLNILNIKITPFEDVYEKFLSIINNKSNGWLDKKEEGLFNSAIKILNSGKQVILHNDLVEGNLLKINNEIKLIDFEYSGLGNPIFDIASFITERSLSKKQISFFINSYDKDLNKEDLLIVSAFLQIFWTRWASYKFFETKKEIYKEIESWKYNEYKKLIKNIKI